MGTTVFKDSKNSLSSIERSVSRESLPMFSLEKVRMRMIEESNEKSNAAQNPRRRNGMTHDSRRDHR